MGKHFCVRLFSGLGIMGVLAAICALVYLAVTFTSAFILIALACLILILLACLAYALGNLAMGDSV